MLCCNQISTAFEEKLFFFGKIHQKLTLININIEMLPSASYRECYFKDNQL